MTAIILTAWVFALSDDDARDLRYDCGAAICSIVKADLQQLISDNINFFRRMTEAEAKVMAPQKCAEVTVTEPSKAPKLPNPPPPPGFKAESNS